MSDILIPSQLHTIFDVFEPEAQDIIRARSESLRAKAEHERRKALGALLRTPTLKGFQSWLSRWHDSTERASVFLPTFEVVWYNRKDAGTVFWQALAAEWSSFDRIPHDRFARALRKWRGAWSPRCMIAEARAAYDSLPKTLTLYRGQSAFRSLGLSWTLDLAVAEGFARGHRGISVKDPAIFELSVPIRSVAFLCTDRKESEVVLHSRPKRAKLRRLSAAQEARGY